MEKLSIEEKAKHYDEAIERAKEWYSDAQIGIGFKANLEKLFPELKEGEGGTKDEMIRKAVISTFKPHCSFYEVSVDEVLAWFEKQFSKSHQKDIDDAYLKGVCDAKRELEKQGEQKTEGKVEPKFHEGDWVVSPNGVYWHIDKISNNRYEVTSNSGESSNWPLDANIYHKFTIQDVKDGDVLAWDDSKCIALFKNIYDEDSFNSYGFVGHCTDTFESRMAYHDIEGAHPATKEQRDTLMKAMTDAGYTFNFEKKELKKIEQKSDNVEHEQEIDYPVNLPKDNWEFVHEFVEKFGRIPKDEDELNVLVEYILKRQKSWSEEDGNLLKLSLENLTELKERFGEEYGKVGDCIDWLKSLSPKWKPNQAEIDFLNMIAGCMNKTLNEPEKAELKRIIKCLKNL